jgi:Bardet-Biedl syndrome 1 protein
MRCKYADVLLSTSSILLCMRGISSLVAAVLLIQVWKGTAKASEHALLDVPVAITSFITDGPAPRLPTLAVAAGPNVYMFRSLRPFYKFTLPAGDITPLEDAVW